jgi:hypothetical protein
MNVMLGLAYKEINAVYRELEMRVYVATIVVMARFEGMYTSARYANPSIIFL